MFSVVKFEYKIIHPNAKPPHRGRLGDAGYDLSSISYAKILPGEMAKISTGLQIAAPSGFYYTLESRSSMLNKGIIVSRGIIDATYTGEIFIILHNHSSEDYEIFIGDRIAQMVPHEILHLDLDEIDEFSPEYCVRGEKGWGSSGR